MASPLEQLPAEVFARITREVMKADGSSLAPFAAASRQCQIHVEASTFSRLRITHSNLPEFDEIVTHRRFLALRRLTYEFQPSEQQRQLALRECQLLIRGGDGDATCHRIDPDELHHLSERFATEITDLLNALRKKSEAGPNKHTGVQLVLGGTLFPVSRIFITQPDEQDMIRFDKAWVNFLEERIPNDRIAPVVTSFTSAEKNMDWGRDGLFHCVMPKSWPSLLARFPRVTKVEIEVFDDHRKCLEGRRQDREAFGLSLRKFSTEVKELCLTYQSEEPQNQHYEPPNLVHPGLGYDIFSRELARLSCRLTKLELVGATVDLVEFFQTYSQIEDCILERLSLREQQMCSAAGVWYFVCDPRADEDDLKINEDEDTLEELRECMSEDELPEAMDHPRVFFRGATDPVLFKKIYLAAAKAVKRMQRLQELDIYFKVTGPTHHGQIEHRFHYSRGLAKMPYGARWSTADIKICWYLIPSSVEPDEELVQEWLEIGKARSTSIELLLDDEENMHPKQYQPRTIASA